MKSIVVEGLSKKYRIGQKEELADSLVGSLIKTILSPWRNFKKLQSLGDYSYEEESLFLAIKDLFFEVHQGEILGIIGKNGAGKSTLLKILSQISEPSSGRVEIFGRVASLLEVGTGFHPELSGRENIYMNGTILGMTRKEIDRKLDEIVEFSGVEKFLDTPVKFYSSGMKVRLGFSVAAHLEPEILIVDEVLAVGDYDFQQRCLGKMEEVSKYSGRTVLFVSHQLSMISALCDRTILLDRGEILVDGNTDKAISRYLKLNKAHNGESYNNSMVDGNGSISLVKIELDSPSGEIFSNGLFSLKIFLSKTIATIKNNARVDVRIDDAFGNGLIWFSSKTNPKLDLNSLELHFRLTKLPLVSGEYFITVYIHDGAGVAAHYSNVQSFFVADFSYLENDVKIPSGQTLFITNYEVF